MLRKLAAQKLRASVSTKMISHVAFCPYCRRQYVDVLEARHLASEMCKQALADPAFASVPALNNTRRVMSRPALQRKAFVLAVGLICVALPLRISAWQIKQNAALRTQWAEQTSSTRQADREAKTAAAYDAPSAPQLALLTEATHTRQIGSSDNDMLPLTLTYPPAKTVIQEDAPIFQWKPVQGAASYEVHIRSLSNRQSKNQPSPRHAETQWKADPPLQRGDVFEWGVTAYDSNNNFMTRSYSEHFLILTTK